MIVLMNVDGVLADFTSHVLRSVGSKLTLADIEPSGAGSPRQCLDFLTPKQKALASDLLDTPEWWSSLPVMRGSQQGVRDIVRSNHQVVFVTSPRETCPGWGHARREWLKRWFGSGFDIIMTSAKHLIYGDVFIDDEPEYVHAWYNLHWKRGQAFLFNAPYNQFVRQGVWRVSWDKMPEWRAEEYEYVQNLVTSVKRRWM